MDFPKYDGNIHPDEWINDIQKYFKINNINDADDCLKIAISLIDPIITVPDEIDSLEKLRNALKEDISFTIFKDNNKRLLRLLKYLPGKKSGEIPKFISEFRKYCYNAEINDIEEQKNYFCHSLPNNNDERYNYLLEFIKRSENIKSMNELIKEFGEIVTDNLNLIKNESIIALKHVVTGKYLSSIENLLYTTGSKTQVVFVGTQKVVPNALWKIKFNKSQIYDPQGAMYNYIYDSNNIILQHVNSGKNSLGINVDYYNNAANVAYYNCDNYTYFKSPITEHSEVSCNGNTMNWKVNHIKLENRRPYLKSKDIINLSVMGYINSQNTELFLRSHDIQFTIGNDIFQEVVCHNERLGGNDEWCIELIKQN